MKKLNLNHNGSYNFIQNNILSIFTLFVLFTTMLTISCSDKNHELNNQNSEEKINKLFDLVDSKIETKSQVLRQLNGDKVIQKAITFLVIRDNNTGEISLANFKEEDYFAPIADVFENSTLSQTQYMDDYTVSCSGGSGGDWESSCGGKFSCGKLIAKCLDEGGCASICNAKSSIEFNGNKFLDIDISDQLNVREIDLSNFSAVKIIKTTY